MLGKRFDLLKVTLRRYNYTLKELQSDQLKEIHERITGFSL